MSEPKYRPSLAANEIHYIIQLLEADKTQPLMARSVSSKLKLFVAKMNLGIVNPAFSSSAIQKQSIEERLGMSTTISVSPSVGREMAYMKWKDRPELCSAFEIKQAQTYRYENDLMTPDEEREYEARN